MAATAWEFYNRARKKLGNGVINLSSDVIKMALFTSASNASTKTLSTYASVSNQVTSGNGYTAGGSTLTKTWTAGASAGVLRFDVTDPVWTGTGGSIANIKFAVVYASGGDLLCKSKLTTSQFTLASGNTLTIQINASGVFEMT